ncbi:hypothetical protein HGRIS_011008 [Hohenbuehelia grisea]|uniref:Uncharacterized protein n=1 Tax=Hohenbuehelia grisea TaxID=104357 RepID=A0ABR3IYS8_9AGAR
MGLKSSFKTLLNTSLLSNEVSERSPASSPSSVSSDSQASQDHYSSSDSEAAALQHEGLEDDRLKNACRPFQYSPYVSKRQNVSSEAEPRKTDEGPPLWAGHDAVDTVDGSHFSSKTSFLEAVTHERILHHETEEVLRVKHIDRHVHHIYYHVQPIIVSNDDEATQIMDHWSSLSLDAQISGDWSCCAQPSCPECTQPTDADFLTRFPMPGDYVPDVAKDELDTEISL